MSISRETHEITTPLLPRVHFPARLLALMTTSSTAGTNRNVKTETFDNPEFIPLPSGVFSTANFFLVKITYIRGTGLMRDGHLEIQDPEK